MQQYGPQGGAYQQPSRGPHPLLFIGIFVYISPMISRAMNFGLPKWISGVGIAMILLGVILSFMKAV